jgi:ATP-dependent RNA helicase HelY
VIERLDAEGLLPAITFIFSRAGCDAAVQQCLVAGLRLTTPDEADEIEQLARARTEWLSDEDRLVLGYDDWLTALRRGIAAHHAGLLPTFKEVVEELFTAGLIRAVFATETLALGINMPARTVVIEKLDKWNGEHHADLTAGEYTQLTGRAGRRGIDVEGHAVVLWQPDMNPVAVAGLADLQHGGESRRSGRPNARGQAPGIVVRPVPGRPGRRRTGPARRAGTAGGRGDSRQL